MFLQPWKEIIGSKLGRVYLHLGGFLILNECH